MVLRDYQERAVANIIGQLRMHRSTLAVMATGTGKALIAAELIRRARKGKALVLVHRAELAYQLRKTIEAHTGLEVALEMGEFRADADMFNDPQVIVATVQTLNSGRRIHGLDPDEFSLIICDEAHHYTSKIFRKAIEHFNDNEDLKVVGLTATPDRADREALGQIFETVAYEYGILDAIDDGWLVPIRQQFTTIEDLDYSNIKTTAGDLNAGQLARVMESEEIPQGVADATLQVYGGVKTIVFTVSVKQAELITNIFNRHQPGLADWVCGTTKKEKRHEIFRKFRSGETPILANVGIATEGFDEPGVGCIVIARATKSRSLYTQMIGRGTRPVGEVLSQPDLTAAERRAAIALSDKPEVIILDFVGNSGRHKLVTTADVLGGKVSPYAAEEAVRRMKQSGTPQDVRKIMDDIDEQEKLAAEKKKEAELAKRANLLAKAKFSMEEVDPFNIFGISPPRDAIRYEGKVLSDKQIDLLLRSGINPTGMSYAEGSRLVQGLVTKWKSKLGPSPKQEAVLRRAGKWQDGMTRKDASKIIDVLARNWKR